MPNTFQIRPARAADADAIARLCADLGYPAQTADVLSRLQAVQADCRQVVYVVEKDDSQVIGWVHVLLVVYLETAPFTEVGGIVVDPAFRRLGVGEQMMLAAEGWAREQGSSSMRLRSNIIREEAHAFYHRLGYHIEKTQYTFSKRLSGSIP